MDNSDIVGIEDVDITPARTYGIPLVNIAGLNESGETLPWNRTSTTLNPPDTIKTPEEHCKCVNIWLEVTRCQNRLTVESILSTNDSENEVERRLGAPFTRTEIHEKDGIHIYIGDFTSEKNVPMFRVIGLENVPHVPVKNFAGEAMEHIFHFSRDPETKEILYRE